MNSLSMQALGNGYDSLALRLAALPEHAQREVLRRAVEWGIDAGVGNWVEANRQRLAGGMGALSQASLYDSVAAGVMQALQPMWPVFGQKLMDMAQPIMQKSLDMIGPIVDQKIRQYGPALAAITGLSAAIFSIVGMYLVGGYVVRKIKAA